jgi:hypothetical protein
VEAIGSGYIVVINVTNCSSKQPIERLWELVEGIGGVIERGGGLEWWGEREEGDKIWKWYWGCKRW